MKSPRLYRYLDNYFQLPSIRTLKAILSKIPFETGINPAILEHLANNVYKMKDANRVCSLHFDEISLSEGLHYQESLQTICGLKDIGSLGSSENSLNYKGAYFEKVKYEPDGFTPKRKGKNTKSSSNYTSSIKV